MAFTKAQFIAFLLSRLPRDFYAAGWSTDTDIYRILEMQSEEFELNSAEVQATRDDLSIWRARTGNIKRNFATYVGPDKWINQLFDDDSYY